MAAVLVPHLRGNVPFGAAPWQWHPESSCARAAFQEPAAARGSDRAVPDTLQLRVSTGAARAEGTAAEHRVRIAVQG